jgi:hypothetical protein
MRMKFLIFASATLASILSISVASAAPAPATVVGTITCGAAEDAPAANAIVEVMAQNVKTRSSSEGEFTLIVLPTDGTFNVDALSDADGSATASRYNLSVQPGETLDIGNLDLGVCPQPALPQAQQSAVENEPQVDDGQP